MKNKKANMIIDSILIMVLLVGLAIGSMIGYKVLDSLNTSFQADDSFTNETKQAVSDANTQYPTLFDGIIVMAFVLLWIVTLIGAFMIDTHPVFFIAGLIMLIAVLVVSANLSNAYQTIAADPDLSTYSAGFPMTNFIINNMVEFIMVIAFSIGIALYAKLK